MDDSVKYSVFRSGPPSLAFVTVLPFGARMRATISPSASTAKTEPSEAWGTSRVPAASMVRLSGPLTPWKETKRPTLPVLPSGKSGTRHTALSRVIETNSTCSSGCRTSPFGLTPVARIVSSRPSGRRR